jgi:zinc protease
MMFRRVVLASTALALVFGPVSGALAQARPVVPATAEASGLSFDPSVVQGRLQNGMRYLIMPNKTPPGSASIRMRVDFGSLMERPQERGLAHFLEHMAFNGTANVEEGEMVKILERFGLAFGPDTNAYTSFDETVYMLDVPKADGEAFDTALFLMREAAGEMLLDQGAIDRERGIVLSEERSRDTPQLRIAKAQLAFGFRGQKLADALPIGEIEVLRTADRARFLELYQRYYRPERTQLVVVGDVDPRAVEAKIKARFSDWTAAGPAGPEPELGRVAQRGTEAKVLVEPGGPLSVGVSWMSPPDLAADTRAERKADLVRSLGFAVLNRRLERLARSERPPFVTASAARSTVFDSADTAGLSVVARPGEWREGLTAAVQEQKRIARYGVLQAELDREIAETRAALQAAVAGAPTRTSPALATAIVATLGDEDVFTTPTENLAVFEEAVAGLKAETVSRVMAEQFRGSGPLLFMTTPTTIEDGEAALLQAWTDANAVEPAAPAATEAKTWPYESFGAPGAVADLSEASDLGATFVRFANGTRLTVKPTRLREGQVLVSVRVGDGQLDLPRDRATPAWAAPFVYAQGGLGELTAEEMQQALASTVYGAAPAIGEDAFTLTGATRPEDFALQMQVLAAYLTDPAFRPAPLERLKSVAPTIHARADSTPGGVFGKNQDLLHGGDKRFAFPSLDEIRNASLDDLKALTTAMTGAGPIEVVIVGDVAVDEAIRQTAATFGALPERPANPPIPPSARAVSFPEGGGEPVVLTHKGRADQGLGYVAWRTDGFWASPRTARTLEVLKGVLQLRLTEELREGQGVTYSPSAAAVASRTFPQYGYVSAAIEAPPEKLAGFFADAAKIAAALRDAPPSADELDRARKPLIESIQRARAGNDYWLGALAGVQADPRRLEALRSRIADLEAVTPADLQAAARKYLIDDGAFRIEVVPEAEPAA